MARLRRLLPPLGLACVACWAQEGVFRGAWAQEALREGEEEGTCLLQHVGRPLHSAPDLNAKAEEPKDGKEKEAAAAVKDAAKAAASPQHHGGKEAVKAKQAAISKVAEVESDRRWNIYHHVFRERQEERRRGLLLCSLLPFGAMLAAALSVVCGLRSHVRRCGSAAEAARSAYLVLTFVLVLNFSIVILDSYDFCSTLGLSQGHSGRMVGTQMLGSCLGSATAWLAQRQHPDLWRQQPRAPLILGLVCQLLGAVVYCVIAMMATDSAGKTEDLPLSIATILFGLNDKPWLSQLLMLSRFLLGLGSGGCQQFFVASMLHITPVPERREQTARWVFAGMLALGSGPMAAAAVQALDFSGAWPRFDLVGYVQVTGVLTALVCTMSIPDLGDIKDCLEPAGEKGQDASSRVLVLGCLGLTGLRSFGVAGIEVALALQLEEVYKWDQRLTGLVTGAVFLCCIPMKLLHSVLGKNLSVVGWIRLFSCLAVSGSLLLFRGACALLTSHGGWGPCSRVLVAAGTVLFPCFYLSDSLCSSLMHQHVLPKGTLLDGNHAQLWFSFSQGLGRFLGPWLARETLQRLGQDAFAMQQLVVTACFLVAFEAFVRPFIAPAVLEERLDSREESRDD